MPLILPSRFTSQPQGVTGSSGLTFNAATKLITARQRQILAPVSTWVSGGVRAVAQTATVNSSAFADFPHRTDPSTPFLIAVSFVRQAGEAEAVTLSDGNYGLIVRVGDWGALGARISLGTLWYGGGTLTTVPCRMGQMLTLVARGTWTSSCFYDVDMFCNGRLVNSYNQGFDLGHTANRITLNTGLAAFSYDIRSASRAECRDISENPWQVFKAPVRRIWIDAGTADGGAIALAGAAQSIVSASGALSVAVPLVGAAVSVATANGALSTALPLSGVAAAVAQASGTLTLGIALSGAAFAKSVAAGALGTRFNVSGAATAHAGASGTTSSDFPLSGAAAAQAEAAGHLAAASPTALTGAASAKAAATGTVTVQFALSGAAVARASASGTLAVGGTSALAGTAQAVPAASGALSVLIPLAGSAQVVAGVTGNLTTGSPLAGAAVAVAAAAGNLMVIVNLTGAAVAQAMASGGLSLQVPLSAAAIAHANASGVLSGGLSPFVSNARYTVRARQRNFTVTHAH